MSTNPTYADPTPETRPETETTPSGRDPWAARDTAEQRISPLAAPFTFDPYCTRRLQNCTDDENAAMPDPETDD